MKIITIIYFTVGITLSLLTLLFPKLFIGLAIGWWWLPVQIYVIAVIFFFIKGIIFSFKKYERTLK